jgi:hypothetical protein
MQADATNWRRQRLHRHLNEQEAQIQKVNAEVEARKPASQMVIENQYTDFIRTPRIGGSGRFTLPNMGESDRRVRRL